VESESKQPTGAPPKAAAGDTGDGRMINLAKKAGIVVGLISGVLGLVFLLFPGLRPDVGRPTPEQKAEVKGLVVTPQTTRGQFLDYSDQSKLGFTKEQLAVVGTSAFASVHLVGYTGKTLTLERQLVDTRTGDVVGQARDFRVKPSAEDVTHRWWDWAPQRPGRGSYILVIKVLDEKQHSAIACGQSAPFAGAAGSLPGRELHLCPSD
jgi:hypothetical protein